MPAIYHLFSDINCSIYKYGEFQKSVKAGEYSTITLNRGVHKIEFISDTNHLIKKEVLVDVPDDSYEGYIEIHLLNQEMEQESTTVSKDEYNNSVKDSVGNIYSNDWRRLLKGERGYRVNGVKDFYLDSRCRVICDEAFFNETAMIFSTTAGGIAIDNLVIPSGLIKIGKRAFRNGQMETITFPESLASIGSQAFWSCSSLLKVHLPSSLETIEFGTFGFCESLQSVVASEGLRRIEGAAFQYCKSLSTVTLPRSISYIDQSAFVECPSLKRILVPKGEKRRISRLLAFDFITCLGLVQEIV